MQMCPFCDKVYDESEYSRCPYCSGELEEDMSEKSLKSVRNVEGLCIGMSVGSVQGV